MKSRTIIDHRHSKATKMSKMVLRALRMSKNVSTKLIMSLSYKQIAPIRLYGSSIWSIKSSHNLICVDNLPEVGNTRTTASKALHDTCAYDIPFTSARRVDKASPNAQIRIANLNVRGPSYLGLTRSISWLLMPWLLASPGHQQPWYGLCRIGRSLFYLRKGFNNLCHFNVEE